MSALPVADTAALRRYAVALARRHPRVLGGALGAIAETVQVERGEVTLDLPAAAFGMLENAERDNVYYRIAVGGDLLTGYADLPGLVVAWAGIVGVNAVFAWGNRSRRRP